MKIFGTSGRNNRQNFEHNGLKPNSYDLLLYINIDSSKLPTAIVMIVHYSDYNLQSVNALRPKGLVHARYILRHKFIIRHCFLMVGHRGDHLCFNRARYFKAIGSITSA